MENHDLPEMKILEIRELLRASTGKVSPPDTKRLRESTELIESFIFLPALASQLANNRENRQGPPPLAGIFFLSPNPYLMPRSAPLTMWLVA